VNPLLIFLGLLLAACLFAWWRGGGPERAVAALFFLAWLVSFLIHTPSARHWQVVEIQTMVVDILLLVALLAISRRANRVWPLVATSLQTLIVLAHLARAVNPVQFPFVYMVMVVAWPIVQLFVLIAGTALHWRRTATRGAEPSWTNSPASAAQTN
jgi:hypothetical protein